ncbi:MAG TPA: GatB/YqeY domain-containing protein [Anaerolineaceae bacterium]|nr:GatB/YqeY domain-containing protein [Anaerolineaceae bacterium]
MNTKQTLENALKDAMRSQNDVARRTIRMALSAIKLAEIEKGAALEEQSVISILQKEIKSRREAIQESQKANRPDLQQASEEEIEVLNKFLPQAMSTEELTALVEAAVEETQAHSPTDMGKVMKVLMPRVQGKAPGDQVSQVVRQILQAKAG